MYDIDGVLNVSSLYALFMSMISIFIYVRDVVYVRVYVPAASVCCEVIGKCMMSMVY